MESILKSSTLDAFLKCQYQVISGVIHRSHPILTRKHRTELQYPKMPTHTKTISWGSTCSKSLGNSTIPIKKNKKKRTNLKTTKKKELLYANHLGVFFHQPHFINHQPPTQAPTLSRLVAFGKPARSSPLESSNSWGTGGETHRGEPPWMSRVFLLFSVVSAPHLNHQIVRHFQPWIIKVFAYVVLIFFDQIWICQCVFVDVLGICWMSNWEPSFQHKQDPKNYFFLLKLTISDQLDVWRSRIWRHPPWRFLNADPEETSCSTFENPAASTMQMAPSYILHLGIEWPWSGHYLLFMNILPWRIANIKKKTQGYSAAWYFFFRWSCFSICVFWSVTKNKPCNDHL